MKPWFLGIDLGTGSCKSVVTNEQAQILGFGSGSYSEAGSQHKWHEQDPEWLIAGMVHSVQAAIQQAGVEAASCQGLSIDGALHCIIAMGHSGQPLSGVITWADGRGVPQAEAVRNTPQAATLFQHTGCPVHGMYPLYKIIWLRQEKPETFEQAVRFITAKEYVFEKLTGKRVVDYSVASGTGLLNVHSLDWDSTCLEVAGITRGHLSPLAGPLTTFQGLDANLAAAMGISRQTQIVLGSSDAANSTFGAGAVHPWQATCNIGSSGAFRIVAPRPILDEKSRLWCYAIDTSHWLVGGGINNGGIALSWLKDLLNQVYSPLPKKAGLSFDDLVVLAGKAGCGAGGLICLPFFTGERSPNWNMNARAVFFGLTLQHDLRHLARALLEGVAFRLRSLDDILREMSSEVGEIRASGGFSHSDLWLQIVADVLNHNLQVPVWRETSCLGAAMWAMLEKGAISSFEEAGDLISVGSQFEPHPKDAAVYDRLYRIYLGLYDNVESAFDQIAQIQQEIGPSISP